VALLLYLQPWKGASVGSKEEFSYPTERIILADHTLIIEPIPANKPRIIIPTRPYRPDTIQVEEEKTIDAPGAETEETSKDLSAAILASPKEETLEEVAWMSDNEDSDVSSTRIIISPNIRGFWGTAEGGGNRKAGGLPPGLDYLGTPLQANHAVPWNVGLEVSILLSHRIALTTGLELSGYYSSFMTESGKMMCFQQKAFYLGIPLKLDWYIWQSGRFSAWVGAGGKVDRCVFAHVAGETVQDKAFNWTAVAESGIQYAISNHIGLFIEPEVSWFFRPENPTLLTYRTEHPFMFTVGVGLRFTF
jgi:hypothetical protein